MAMLIGRAGPALTSICTSDASSIEVRGYDLTKLIGTVSFTECFFLLVAGKLPTKDQHFFLDALLVAIAEHGLTPTAQAARMTLAADRDCLQAAVAAGILGCGSVVLGTSEKCGALLAEAQKHIDRGASIASATLDIAKTYRAEGKKIPGFGHPIHHPVDPRTVRLFELASTHNIDGPHIQLAKAFQPAVAEAWGRDMPMNVSMAIAAILLDLDFPRQILKAIPILARTGGILGHLAEETQRPIGFLMSHHADAAIAYDNPQKEGE